MEAMLKYNTTVKEGFGNGCGNLKPGAYSIYFDEAKEYFLEKIGLSDEWLRKRKAMLIVSEINYQILAEVPVGSKIEIESSTSNVKKTSFELDQTMISNGRKASTATTKCKLNTSNGGHIIRPHRDLEELMKNLRT